MRHYFVLGFVFTCLAGAAQPCGDEWLLQKPGTWKGFGFTPNPSNILPSDLAKEKKLLTDLQKMVAASYKPQGCETRYSFVVGKNLVAAKQFVADPFYVSIWVKRFRCDAEDPARQKYHVEGETPTYITITANLWEKLNTLYAGEIPESDIREYFKLPKRPVLEEDGRWFLGETSKINDTYIEQAWLVSYDDQLPFDLVSRREYCEMLKRKLNKDINEDPGQRTYFEGFIQKINDYLATASAEELKLAACCSWNDEERFEGFVEEGTPGSFLAVKPNMAYYRKLPKSSPQFFVVSYTWRKGDPIYEANIAGLKKAIDLKALKILLGK